MKAQSEARIGTGSGQNNFRSIITSMVGALGISIAMRFLLHSFAHHEFSTFLHSPFNMAVDTPNNLAFRSRPQSLDEGAWPSLIPKRIMPIWDPDSLLDLTIVVSTSSQPEPLLQVPQDRLIVKERAFDLGNPQERRVIDSTFKIPEEPHHNGQLWGHFYIGLTDAILDPSLASYDPGRAFYFTQPLTHYFQKRNLPNKTASGQAHIPEPGDSKFQRMNAVYHPNFTMSFIPDAGIMSYPSMDRAIRQHLHLETTGARDGSGQNGWYYPILFVNTFWQLKTDMIELSDTVKTLPIRVDLNTQKRWLFQILAVMNGASNQRTSSVYSVEQSALLDGEKLEIDLVKKMWLESNKLLMEMLAFMIGLYLILASIFFMKSGTKRAKATAPTLRSSLRRLLMNAVIFLYLSDDGDYSSRTMLFVHCTGMVSEISHIAQLMWLSSRTLPPANVILQAAYGTVTQYRFDLRTRYSVLKKQGKIEDFEGVIFESMLMTSIAISFAYGIYSLAFGSQNLVNSTYSNFITTFAIFIHAYELLMIAPALYMNYCRKKVPFVPTEDIILGFLRMLIENLVDITFRTHALHRTATFRNTVLVLASLYQNLAYDVDHDNLAGEVRHDPKRD